MAPLIAIVGSDGAGKSTVGEALIAWMRSQRPAELCHLGKQSGNLGRLLADLPLVGKRMGRSIEQNVQKAESAKGPGFFASLVIYAFTIRRMRRFRRMLALRERGIAILADRFPQLSLPSGIDGPGFGRVRCDRGIARILAAREWRQFEWMTSHRPDLVIKLRVDVATAIARKPDHVPERLAAKIDEIARIDFHAPTVEIDANQPVEVVIAEAKSAIAPLLQA